MVDRLIRDDLLHWVVNYKVHACRLLLIPLPAESKYYLFHVSINL